MDGWYYRLFGIDFGPVEMEKLVELINSRSLSRGDEVKFGEKGLWRRVGTIGPLMAHLPFESGEQVTDKPKPVQDFSDTDFEMKESSILRDAVKEPENLLDSLDLDSLEDADPNEVSVPAANSTYVTPPSPTAKSKSPSVATIPRSNGKSNESDAKWWCTIQGKEYGPVELPKLLEWAESGRLRRDDFVRYGLEAYTLADQLPGLFPELPQFNNSNSNELATASDLKSTAPNVKPNSTITPTPTITTSEKPSPVKPGSTPVTAVSEAKPQAKPTPAAPSTLKPPVAQPAPTPVASSPPIAKPVKPTKPPKAPKAARSSGGGDLGGTIKKILPALLGVVGVVVVGALLYFGIQMLPASTGKEIEQYKTLMASYSDLANLRSKSDPKPEELKTAQKKILDAASPILSELNALKHRNPNQLNIQKLAKKLENIGKDTLDEKKSRNELDIDSISRIAAGGLKIKP